MPKLVNFGSLCIDWAYQVPSLVGSGETLTSTGRTVHAGGKGLNQSFAAARAGAEVLHFGAVGEDGETLVAVLDEVGVRSDGVARIDTASGHAVIQVDPSGQNAIVIFPGANRLIPAQVREQALHALLPGDWLLLQNETNDVAEMLTQAAAKKVNAAINLAPADDHIHDYPLELAQLLIVNEVEAMALAKSADLNEAWIVLRERFTSTDMVLTLGHQGLWCARAETKDVIMLNAHSVSAVDETAAGDSFIGYLMAAMLAGQPLPVALEAASAAGALAVTRSGASTSIPTRDQVETLVAKEQLNWRTIA